MKVLKCIHEKLLAFYPILDATATGLMLFLTDLMKNLNLENNYLGTTMKPVIYMEKIQDY